MQAAVPFDTREKAEQGGRGMRAAVRDAPATALERQPEREQGPEDVRVGVHVAQHEGACAAGERRQDGV